MTRSEEARTCTGCGNVYPIECFHRYRRNEPRRRARCKFCQNTERNRAYLDHPERWEHRLERERRRHRRIGHDRYTAGLERQAIAFDLTKIVRALLADGFTINGLAAAAGISRSTVIEWKHDRIRNPKRAGVRKLRAVYRDHIERQERASQRSETNVRVHSGQKIDSPPARSQTE